MEQGEGRGGEGRGGEGRGGEGRGGEGREKTMFPCTNRWVVLNSNFDTHCCFLSDIGLRYHIHMGVHP